MTEPVGVSGIVLAGGLSRRLGRDKAVELFNGQPLINRVLDRLSQLAEDLVVVVNTPERGAELPIPDSTSIAVDVYPDSGSLGGIFAGLSASKNEWGIVVACDMPFLNFDLITYMLSVREDQDIVVPVIGHRPEPTHAIYSTSCLPHIEARLKMNDLKITKFFDEVRTKHVSQRQIEGFDPNHLSFFNVNTPDELAEALVLASEGY